MTDKRKIEPELRQIGWDYWDPIAIRSIEADGPSAAWRSAAADEYDTYLLEVACMLRAGASYDEAAAYLDHIASDYIGLGERTEDGRQASRRTVEAIARYIQKLA